MRERISKIRTGGNNTGRKEVRVKVNRSGLSAYGEQRYSLAIRFAEESYKKITGEKYIVPEIDRDLKRIYFFPAAPDDGFKLTGTKSEHNKSITFTIKDMEQWKETEGCYFLLKDTKENAYYIDYTSTEA